MLADTTIIVSDKDRQTDRETYRQIGRTGQTGGQACRKTENVKINCK